MKESIGTILVFLGSLTAVFCGLVLLYFFPLYGELYTPGSTAPYVWAHVKQYLPEIIIMSVLICLFLIFGRLKRKPGKSVLTYTLIFAGAFILCAAALNLEVLDYREKPNPFIEHHIHPLDSGTLIFAGEVTGNTIHSPAASIANTAGIRRFHLFEEAEVNTRQQKLLIPERGLTIPVAPSNPFYSKMFIPDRSFGWIIGPVRGFLASASRTSDQNLSYQYILLFSGFIMILSSHWLIHRNDWPLANAVITVMLFCGFFLLFKLIQSDSFLNFAGFVFGEENISRIGQFLSIIIFWYFTLVFILSRSKAAGSGKRARKLS